MEPQANFGHITPTVGRDGPSLGHFCCLVVQFIVLRPRLVYSTSTVALNSRRCAYNSFMNSIVKIPKHKFVMNKSSKRAKFCVQKLCLAAVVCERAYLATFPLSRAPVPQYCLGAFELAFDMKYFPCPPDAPRRWIFYCPLGGEGRGACGPSLLFY